MERGIGPGAVQWFFGEVVNRGDGEKGKADSTESGRAQIRIHGKHKDISDSDLPWAMPLMPMGSGASNGGVGKAPIGLKNGSTVFGMFADAEQTIPIILGILHKAGSDSGGNGTTVNSQDNDVPEGARSNSTGGGDKNRVLGKDMTGDQHAKKDQKHKDKKTIGGSKFRGEEVHEAINQDDQQNESGYLPQAPQAAKTMIDLLSQSGGAGGFMSSFSDIIGGNMDIQGFLGQAQGMLSQVQSMAGSSGGGGGGGSTPTYQPLTVTPPPVSNTIVTSTTQVGSYIIDIKHQGDTTTATYRDITVQIKTISKNAYGGILDTRASFKRDNVLILTDLNVEDVMNYARNTSVIAEAVVEAAQTEHSSYNMLNNAYVNTPTPVPNQFNPNQGGGGNNGGGIGNMLGQFMGPIQSMISSMGGLEGMTGMDQDNTALEGPLTKNFTAATQTAKTLKQMGKRKFQGAKQADIPGMSDISNMLGQGGGLGNIAGITDVLGGDIGGILNTAMGIVQQVAGAGGGSYAGNVLTSNFGAVTPRSLNNSTISLPASTPNTIRRIQKDNPGFSVDYAPELSEKPVTPKKTATTSGVIMPQYQYNSATVGINSLNNSVISVDIPPVLTSRAVTNALKKNPGVNYELLGTLYTPLGE